MMMEETQTQYHQKKQRRQEMLVKLIKRILTRLGLIRESDWSDQDWTIEGRDK